MHAAAARADAKYDIIKCANCTQEHWATARTCAFYKARFDAKGLAALFFFFLIKRGLFAMDHEYTKYTT